MKTFEYRLYPTNDQKHRLMQCLIESRKLYNEMLEVSLAHHKETGKFLFKYALNKLFAGRSGKFVPASTVQCLADRLDRTFEAYFHRKELGNKVGLPRFKTANQWHSIQLRQYGSGRDFRIDFDVDRFLVPKILGKSIKIKLHRAYRGIPKTCHLILRGDDHWYALIFCDVPKQTIHTDKNCTHESIGIDVGLKSFLTDSNGKTVDNPRFFRKTQKKLRKAERIRCRRNKDSNRRKKAAKTTSKVHLKVARQRRDFHFKTAKKYADKYKVIVVEDLNIEGMVQNKNLSKSILDVGWYQFITILTFKAENAGHKVVAVNPAYTSQQCNQCKEIVQKSLSVRTHICAYCGYIADRDVNAAKNILAKGLEVVKQAGAQPATAKPCNSKVRLRNQKVKT